MVKFEILTVKGETIDYIKWWRNRDLTWPYKTNVDKFTEIAIYLACKPKERKLLSELGAVRISRKEALDIIKSKQIPVNYDVVMVADQQEYVDDTVDIVTLIFYLDCRNQHYASYMDHTKCME
eukprot:6624163-Heterocapsa_arctica.AAC.1